MTPEPERPRTDTQQPSRSFPNDVDNRLRSIRKQFPRITSAHEGFGVLYIKINDFWNCVKLHPDHILKHPATYIALRDIAAVAQRIAEDVITTPCNTPEKQ